MSISKSSTSFIILNVCIMSFLFLLYISVCRFNLSSPYGYNTCFTSQISIVALICTLSISLISNWVKGNQIVEQYYKMGLTIDLYIVTNFFSLRYRNYLFIIHSLLFALAIIFLIIVVNFSLLLKVTPKSFSFSSDARSYCTCDVDYFCHSEYFYICSE